jgi:hypothetical protein
MTADKSRSAGNQNCAHGRVLCFFAGIFLKNVVPQFMHGISGERFPALFAQPSQELYCHRPFPRTILTTKPFGPTATASPEAFTLSALRFRSEIFRA